MWIQLQATGVRKQLSKEVSLRRRILFFCNFKGAIARENALLLLKPFKVVDGVANLNSIEVQNTPFSRFYQLDFRTGVGRFLFYPLFFCKIR